VISKPFDLDELEQRMRDVIDESRKAESSRVR
jgi:DNA-binding response OmpR family regulator